MSGKRWAVQVIPGSSYVGEFSGTYFCEDGSAVTVSAGTLERFEEVSDTVGRWLKDREGLWPMAEHHGHVRPSEVKR